MNRDQKQALDEWLEGRPQAVKDSAYKYPPGTKFLLHDRIMHVISYDEEGGISVTPVDPGHDYEWALAERVKICSCCLHNLEQLKVE